MIPEKKCNFPETSVSVKLFYLAVPQSEFEILEIWLTNIPVLFHAVYW